MKTLKLLIKTGFFDKINDVLCFDYIANTGMLIKFDFVTFMTFKQIHNSDLYCFVFDGNQVGVAMQRLAFVDSIRPRNAGRTQIVAAVNCADAGKVGRNSYNCNTANPYISIIV